MGRSHDQINTEGGDGDRKAHERGNAASGSPRGVASTLRGHMVVPRLTGRLSSALVSETENLLASQNLAVALFSLTYDIVVSGLRFFLAIGLPCVNSLSVLLFFNLRGQNTAHTNR